MDCSDFKVFFLQGLEGEGNACVGPNRDDSGEHPGWDGERHLSLESCSSGPQPGAGAPLSRLQTQGARAGLRGRGVGGGQAEREGRRRAGQKVCGPGGTPGLPPRDARLAAPRPQHARVSCSPWVSRDQALPTAESPRPHLCARPPPWLAPLPGTAHSVASPAFQALAGAWGGTWAHFLSCSFLPWKSDFESVPYLMLSAYSGPGLP